MEIQGQPNPDNLFANNVNTYNTNNDEILTSSHGAFNNPPPPPPSPSIPVSAAGVHHGRAYSDGDLWDFDGDPFNDFDDDLLASLLDIENLGQAHENGGGVSLMDHDGGSGHELKKHDNVDHGNGLSSEDGGGRGGDNSNKLENHDNVGDGKSCPSEGSRQQRNNGKNKTKRGPRRYDLSEIWAVDPDRAKRLLEGRIYMARSRAKKVRYVSELEEKAKFLESKATTLSTKLTTYQRDKMGLTTENADLKILLEVKQQQAELRDALSEALKQEVEKLRISNGGIKTPPESFVLAAPPSSPLASLSPSQPPMHYKLLSSPSTLQSPQQSSPFDYSASSTYVASHSPVASPSPSSFSMNFNNATLASPSTLQSPLQSSPFNSASSPYVVSHSPVASPSPSSFNMTFNNAVASSPSLRTRKNFFPLPKMSSAALSQLSPMQNSGSSLLNRRGLRPTNLPTPPK